MPAQALPLRWAAWAISDQQLGARALDKKDTSDYNGNTLTKTDSNDTTTYAWDFENRLTSVTLPGSGGAVSLSPAS